MGVGFFGKIFSKGSKVSPTIKSVKPSVPKTKAEKVKSRLKILKQRTKGSQARLDQNLFETEQASKKRKEFKRGTGLRKPSNVEKIKKAFGSKKSLGMQSVIYGLDKNPNITKADPKAKFIAAAIKKKKKKII